MRLRDEDFDAVQYMTALAAKAKSDNRFVDFDEDPWVNQPVVRMVRAGDPAMGGPAEFREEEVRAACLDVKQVGPSRTWFPSLGDASTLKSQTEGRGVMPTGSSIVGTWNTFVDWGDTGSPIIANPLTFNPDGSWTYQFGGGQWVQVEGMYFFNFNNAAGLVYAANVTRDSVSGIMGYAVAGSSPGSGVWWGTRPGAPHLIAEQERAAAEAKHDVLLSPQPEN